MDLLQQLVDEERAVLSQYDMSFPSDSENLIPLRAEDGQTDHQQWQRLQAFPGNTAPEQEGAWSSWSDASQRAPVPEERIEESDDVPSLDPPPSTAVAEAICLMVEDPYFDTPMSSPSSEEGPADFTPGAASPTYTTPLLFLNDQTLNPTPAASGKCADRMIGHEI